MVVRVGDYGVILEWIRLTIMDSRNRMKIVIHMNRRIAFGGASHDSASDFRH